MKTKTYMGVKLTGAFYDALVKTSSLRAFCIEYKRNIRSQEHGAYYVCSSIMVDILWSDTIKGSAYWQDVYQRQLEGGYTGFDLPAGHIRSTVGNRDVVLVRGITLSLELYNNLVRLEKLDKVVEGIIHYSTKDRGTYIYNDLNYAFSWDETEEGRDYWRKIHHDVLILNGDPAAASLFLPEDAQVAQAPPVPVGLTVPFAWWNAAPYIEDDEEVAVDIWDEEGELPEEEEATIMPAPQVPTVAAAPPPPPPTPEIVEPTENYTGGPINEQEVI